MLSLPAELTHVQAKVCLAALTVSAAAEGSTVELNAEPLQRFDSSALAVLLEFQRVCAGLGKTVVMRGLPRQLFALATLYGIEGLLDSA